MPNFTPRFELGLSNVTATIANIHATDREIKAELRAVVRRVSEGARDDAFNRAAVDTGFMREHLRVHITPDGLVWDLGWSADDFLGEGKPFYPYFVEFGTSRMEAQPALLPAFHAAERRMKVETTAAIRRAIARRGAARAAGAR